MNAAAATTPVLNTASKLFALLLLSLPAADRNLTTSKASPRDPESCGDCSFMLALAGLTRSRKRAFAPRSACETTAPAGYKVYFGTLRRGLGLRRSCPALPAATAVKIFLWNLWTTLETGQRTLKTDPGPKVIVSRMSHPFFPLGHSCFTRAA